MSLSLAAATAIGAGLSFAGGLAANGINYNVAKQNMQSVERMNAENIAFQQKENDLTRLREDNAVQRAAADMQAAGLSKTLAAGNPASAAALTAPKTQAVTNQFKYESALQKMNLGQIMLDMASKQQQLDINKGVADAQIANINADTVGKGLANDNYLKNLSFEWDVKSAQAANFRANTVRVEAETELYKIEKEYKADQIMADIGYKVSQTSVNNANVGKIAQDIAESIARSNNLDKQTEKLVVDIVTSELQNKSLRINHAYAEKYGLPVGTVLPGVYGNAIQTASSVIKNANSYKNPKGELILKSTSPFSFPEFKGIVPSAFNNISFHTPTSPGAFKRFLNKLF